MNDSVTGITVEILGAEVNGAICRLTWRDGVVISMEPMRAASTRRPPGTGSTDTVTIDADGAAVLPGLWDHHLHVAAMAAAEESVSVDPSTVAGAREMSECLRRATPDEHGWIRGVGYHESVAGDLDATTLDALLGDRRHVPVRIQHRTGQMWILNSAAMEAARLDESASPAVERDSDGRPTGRVFADDVVDVRDGSSSAFTHKMAGVLERCVADGVTGVTDMTPTTSPTDVEDLRAASRLAGSVRLAWSGSVRLGPVDSGGDRVAAKFLPPDHADPDFAALVDGFRAARDMGLNVAVHCVTRVGAAVAIAAWREVGAAAGDRLEHGALLGPEAMEALADLGVTVVTQPNFVAERGDRYLADVDPGDIGHLWRCGSLRESGVRVAAGTDAPFGSRDPWAAMRAAVDRRTRSGTVLGAGESLSPADALGLFLGRPDRPWETRRVRPGERTDLCLLTTPLAEALSILDRSVVRGTVGVAGFSEQPHPAA